MKKNKTALLALLACTAAARAADDPAGCQYREEASIAAAPVKESQVTILGMTPTEGAEVRKTTVLGIDVEYKIANFEPDKFFLAGMFPAGRNNSMSTHDPENPVYLTSAAGKVHFCVPLQKAYEYPTMTWPLSMRVMVMQQASNMSSRSVAFARNMKLNAQDAPARAPAADDPGYPVEYHDALMKVSGFFGTRAARYKVCIERFPAMQPAFTKGYRAWENKYRAEIDLVSEAQFDDYKSQAQGRTEVAAQIDETASRMYMEAFRKTPSGQLKQQCDYALQDVTDPEDLGLDAITDELATVRKYRGAAAAVKP